jgi:hypothetical protein
MHGDRCSHRWQVYATVAEANECLTKNRNQLTD